ncbi:Chemotaxis protein CheA [Fundidesulfovibrio magnetotacticus]|uniref:Chemotaxis protein CheA n=1 Tax=Fundidesulfovibrio magnetotacticus TaxID=2730080 RepID=A0A6V8LP25_9BACT|nr:chemotaxis protein CheA [Fundidesulfovibrio magnetotacticus]GFK94323.1 Chemotaxis protein CheA [Fundidesulfovibrio magnetotacticus]
MEDTHRQAFRDEAADLLSELEEALLELDEDPGDMETVNRVFRAMHTLKGSGAMFGFDDVAHFTHEVETVFDLVRSGKMSVTKELLDVTLASKDHVKVLLENDGEDLSRFVPQGMAILDRFNALSKRVAGAAAQEQAPGVLLQETPGQGCTEGEERVYRVRLRPSKGIYATGNNPAYLLEDLAAKGSVKLFAHLEDIPPLEDLEPEDCHVWWDALVTTSAPEASLRDIFLFVEDECQVEITLLDASADTEILRLGEILVDRGDVSPEGLRQALRGQKRLGAILAEEGLLPGKSVDAALAEQNLMRERQEGRRPEVSASLRVSAEKLDVLQDLVGELVIVQAQIRQIAPELGHPLMLTLSEQLERLSDEIRDSTLSIRMLPIGSTFGTYRRLVRDLSAETGKEIDLVTSGEDTELDKTVLDRLGDALVHLLRNSIDHGVEPPAEREAVGKPRRGSVRLEAEHSGGDVVIRVEDDGRGIDPAKVRAKAVERGLMAPDAEYSNRQILDFIFQPGFSTARTVSSVSGRGVGMDVVKRVVNSMRGQIELDSVPGRGSTVTIRLPLTLAIIDGLQVRVADQGYVMPLDLVEECVELERASQNPEDRRRTINLRGEVVPYVSLREWFGFNGKAPAIEQVVVLTVEGSRLGMVVDQVVGEHQTVIKSLGPMFRGLEGFSGATIQGDGTMSLILDVKRIARLARGDAL